jgi:predicted dehydrogenase
MTTAQAGKQEFKVGVIGAGTMGGVHSDAYGRIDGTRVAAVCDLIPERAESLAKKCECRFTTSWEDVFNDPEIDILDICVPTDSHMALVLPALDTSKDIVCEKPLALRPGEGERILAKCRKRPNRIFIAHVVRFFPEYRRVHDMVDAGELGNVGVVRFHRCGALPFGGKTWFGDDALSGGVLLDLVCHDFDFLNWTFGLPERVYAQYRQAEGPPPYKYALAVLRFPGGVLAHGEGSWAHPPGTFFARFAVAGSKGVVAHDSRGKPSLSYTSTEQVPGNVRGIGLPENPFLDSPYLVELRHFIRHLRGEEDLLLTVEDAYHACQVSLAAIRSAETGRPIDLCWEGLEE